MSAGNVVSIDGGRIPELGEPNDVLIKVLTTALEHAKTGNLQSFIGCGFMQDGCRLAVWAGDHPNVYEMLGSLAWLQHEYVDRIAGRKEAAE